MPTVEPIRPARSAPQPDSRARAATRDTRTDGISRSAVREPASHTRAALPDSRSTTRAPASRTEIITQRSTLTDFSGATGRTTFRGDSPTPNAPLSTRLNTVNTTSRPQWGYYGTYWNNTHYRPYSTYGTLSANFCLGGGFSIGFSSGWYWPWSLGWSLEHHVYFGAFAAAYLVGNAWTIQPYYGGWGYYRGPSCYWLPYASWNTCDWYSYHGSYCRVYRPYWRYAPLWYAYQPYRYGYTTLVYESLYDEGYGSGYDRGYEDGAEDASALHDDRRRDSLDRIGPRPQPQLDRKRASARTEYVHEMDRGESALARGDYATATRAFKEAAILDPESADARYLLAASAMAERKFAFAAFALRRALTIDSAAGNLDLVALFGNMETLRQHRNGLDSRLVDEPGNPDLLLLKGFVALRGGDARVAAEALDKSLRQNPEDEAAKKLLAEAMEMLEEK